MTNLEREIRQFILRALHATKGSPLLDETLKSSVRSAFRHLVFTDGDLRDHIKACEAAELIAGTSDEVFGAVWVLTAKGKIAAQQIG